MLWTRSERRGIGMNKTLLVLVLALGLCLLAACGRHPATTEEVTEPSTVSTISASTPTETSGKKPSPTATPTPTPSPTPVYIYMDFEGNVIDKSVLDPYSEVDGVKYYVYEEDGQYGVKTGDGKILTEAIYDRIYDFSQITRRAYVFVDGLAGMIDLNGNVVIEPKYDLGNLYLEYYEASLFFFLQDGLYGALDLDGNVVFEPKYVDILLTYGNPLYMAVVNEEGKSGIIDNKGNLVVDCQYEYYEIWNISPSGYYFTAEGLHTLEGKYYVTHNHYSEIYIDPDMSAFWACSDDGENFGIFNILTGEYQYPPTGGSEEFNTVGWWNAFAGMLPTSPYATFTYAGKQGIADIEKGTIIFEPIYEEIEYCHNGYFKYFENGKYGLMNVSGKILLSCQYSYIYATSPYGEVVVSAKGGQGIVNISGKTLLAPQDSYRIGPYLSEMNGFEILNPEFEDSIGIANRDGTIRVEPEMGTVVQRDWVLWDEEYDYTDTDFFILDSEDGDKILRTDGFIDILDYVAYSGELIIVQDKNGLMGLINSSGETLIEPFAKSVEFDYYNGRDCLKVVD
jgi:hypothetical protein